MVFDGTYVNGVPVPTIGSTGWGDELNDFLTTTGQASIDVRQAPYNAAIDGATTDTTAVNAAVDAASAAGGGIVYVGPGTCMANVVLKPRVTLRGAGVRATTIKAVNGSNGAAVKGLNFDTLTGKAKAAGDYASGAYESAIADLTVDGNKANVASGYPISLWGRGCVMDNVEVINGKSGGIWTEFTDVDSFTDTAQVLEAYYRSIRVHGCSGSAWIHRGPHDALCFGYTAWANTGWALRVEASAGSYNGGMTAYIANSFLNDTGSFYSNAAMAIHRGAATAANVGTGVEFATGTGENVFEGIIAGHDIGAKLSGVGHRLDASLGGGNITNDVQINGLGWSRVRLIGGASATPAVINMTGNESGPNNVKCLVNLPGGGVVKTGAGVISSASTYELIGQGAAVDKFIQQPWSTVQLVGGYEWGEYAGTGSPEGAVTAGPGAVYQDKTNGEVYVKDSGTGNTNWKVITHA